MAEVSPGNLQKLGGFLKDRIVGKTMKMSVEAYGKKVSVEASSQVEFDYQLQKAEEMIQRWAEDSKKT